jgi:hypothetical protein
VSLVMAWRQRAQPAGMLRLEPGRLRYTARPGLPIETSPQNLRDYSIEYGHLMVRQKLGPRIVINPARLSVPLATIAAALDGWAQRGSVAEPFVRASAEAQLREERRQRRLFWYRAIAFGCALAAALLKMLLAKH